jgi:hypothetical protein
MGKRLRMSCSGLLVLFAGISLLIPSARAGQQKRTVGTLGMIEGEVTLDSVPVKNGGSVHEGAVIEVEDGGRATLLLGKGSVFHLAGGTKFVVRQYGVMLQDSAPGVPPATTKKSDSTKEQGTAETADLDLKFGKTRALILNQGGRRIINIRSRAATMGVRGTEILLSAPKNPSEPVTFVTLEGLAELKREGQAEPILLEQNRGYTTRDSGVAMAPKEVGEVRSRISAQGLAPAVPKVSEPISPPPRAGGFGGVSEGNPGGLPPVRFDPLQDRKPSPGIAPVFCGAETGTCP